MQQLRSSGQNEQSSPEFASLVQTLKTFQYLQHLRMQQLAAASQMRPPPTSVPTDKPLPHAPMPPLNNMANGTAAAVGSSSSGPIPPPMSVPPSDPMPAPVPMPVSGPSLPASVAPGLEPAPGPVPPFATPAPQVPAASQVQPSLTHDQIQGLRAQVSAYKHLSRNEPMATQLQQHAKDLSNPSDASVASSIATKVADASADSHAALT